MPENHPWERCFAGVKQGVLLSPCYIRQGGPLLDKAPLGSVSRSQGIQSHGPCWNGILCLHHCLSLPGHSKVSQSRDPVQRCIRGAVRGCGCSGWGNTEHFLACPPFLESRMPLQAPTPLPSLPGSGSEGNVLDCLGTFRVGQNEITLVIPGGAHTFPLLPETGSERNEPLGGSGHCRSLCAPLPL